MQNHAERRRAWLRGRKAESVAAWWLRLKGYRILAQDFRVPGGEIDLVARRGDALAFVEVKTRPSLSEAAQSLTPRQQRRIAQAAEIFLQRHRNLVGLTLRFDLVIFAPGRLPRHFPNAWQDARSDPRYR